MKHYHSLLQFYDKIYTLTRTVIPRYIKSTNDQWDTSCDPWNNTFYATTPSISPIVAFSSLEEHGCYTRGTDDRYSIEFADPPYPLIGLIATGSDPDNPPIDIKAMVNQTKRLQKDITEMISSVSVRCHPSRLLLVKKLIIIMLGTTF